MASLPVRDQVGVHLLTPQPDPRRWQALALVCVAFFMTVLDGTIVTVALPSIKSSLHVSYNTLQPEGDLP
jgi:hypothetical protein